MRIQEDENLRMKHKFEKIEQSSSSSGDESVEEQTEQKDAEALQDEPNSAGGVCKENDGRKGIKVDERLDSMCLEESESGVKAKDAACYSEESNSPFSQGRRMLLLIIKK